MIEFAFEHDFSAPSMQAYWRCYFDPEHVARLDQALGLRGRELLEEDDRGDTVLRRYHVTPARQIPAWLRKVTGAGLDYEERSLFRESDNRIEIAVTPALFGSRTRIRGVYSVEPVSDGVVRRRWVGSVEIAVPLIGGRIERAVIADMDDSYRIAVPLTQACLDDCAGE